MKDILGKMLAELRGVIEGICEAEAKNFMEAILAAKRVFLFGMGRVGLVLRMFAMRLMHLGLSVYFVEEVTTPPIQEDDLYITGTGAGYLPSLETLARVVKKNKARVAFLSAYTDTEMGRLSDLVVKIPGKTMRDDPKMSIQPLGSQFEQALLLFLDAVAIALMERLNCVEEEMKKRHANIQ